MLQNPIINQSFLIVFYFIIVSYCFNFTTGFGKYLVKEIYSWKMYLAEEISISSFIERLNWIKIVSKLKMNL